MCIFAHESVHCVAHLADSDEAERTWCLLHTDLGPFLLGLWYRAPDAPLTHLTTLEGKWARLAEEAIGSILVGDQRVPPQVAATL